MKSTATISLLESMLDRDGFVFGVTQGHEPNDLLVTCTRRQLGLMPSPETPIAMARIHIDPNRMLIDIADYVAGMLIRNIRQQETVE